MTDTYSDQMFSVTRSCPIPQVVQRIKAVDLKTRLLVVDSETYESLRSLRLTATEEMAIVGSSSSSSSPPASPSLAPSSTPSSPIKKRENGSVSKQPVALSTQVQKPTRRSPSKAAKKVRPSTQQTVRIKGNDHDVTRLRKHRYVRSLKGDETMMRQ